MSPAPKRARALGLVSGGLDSTLALALMLQQNLEVRAVHFYTGLCITETQRRMGVRRKDGQAPRNEALRAGSDLKIEVELIDVSGPEYMNVIADPQFGYGANANPCIDCRSFMLGRARKVLEAWGGDFVFTGEVLGQRPMSQRRWAMQKVEEVSGLEDRLLRPLSAKLMAPIAAERAGWVDRQRLLGLSGRSRRPQIELAAELGLEDFPQPAGGCCYLADEGYGRRFKDLLSHRPSRSLTPEEATLLAAGRHFRLSAETKLIVARNDQENAVLERYAGDRFHVMASEVLGPVGLVEGAPSPDEKTLASQIVARYGKGKGQAAVTVQWRREGRLEAEFIVGPLDAALDLGNILV